MKKPLLVLALAFTFFAVSTSTALADHCCGGSKPKKQPSGEEEAKPPTEESSSIHGGTLAKSGSHIFETVIGADQVRVYVFDAKSVPLPVAKLGGKVTFVPERGKKMVVTLKPVAARQGRRQAHLAGKHRFPLPAVDGSKLEISVSRLGDDRKGSASFEVPPAETAAVSYVCPMHADQRSEDPGNCGKCKMALGRKVKSVPKAPKVEKAAYACPMHPKATSDKPGKCPDCGMSLKKMKGARKASYACPMHPKATSDKPGKCPDCGMSLKKAQAAEQEGDSKGGSGGCGGCGSGCG